MSLDTAATPADASEQEVLHVTEAALAKVLEVRAGEPEPESMALRVEIVGTSGSEYTYHLAFESLDYAQPTDHRQTTGGLTLLISGDSVGELRGATLDLPSTVGQGGLVIRNPNRPNPLAAARDLTLEGDTAEKVQQLLNQVINPQLADHGGFVSLVGVDSDIVYLTMGGGCHGCSMSEATMVQGVASSIRDAIPEVVDVVDVTDHAQGENPFYT